MPPEGKRSKHRVVVAAVSGGPDSVYLLLGKLAQEKGIKVGIGHVNYGMRGKDSLKDQVLVENIGKELGYKTEILVVDRGKFPGGRAGIRGRFPAGFEKKAREIRFRFLKDLSEKAGAEAIALAHTADDQVETILMRVFEGAGIGGLKGIPRETGDGIVRPILDEWKEDILNYLKKRKIPYRIDRSNFDIRFERNWVRNVLLPLLVKRYGKSVKKRIFTLGERFRELDDYLEAEAQKWIRKSMQKGTGRGNDGPIRFRRETYSALPTVLRVKILQRICFDRLGVAPNERLLNAMDRNVSHGGPSARVNAGKGWKLANRYEEAFFVPGESGKDRKSAVSALGKKAPTSLATPGEVEIPLDPKGRIVTLSWESQGKRTPAQAKRLAAKGDAEVFDAAGLTLPLTVRPLRAGDRIRPFGGSAGRNARDGEKKVKEILIDRKIPRDDRWGRPVLCDAGGAILWIPGVLRSAHAPVTPETRKTALLRIRATK
ncbi:MAG: tRNA lysidine(34) synthetase TilS [Deltaproteobacteria bacterium]|nr:tRNA lysidine(34) synthetase TilS [Deltaproteobacteria bacterium]